jgi:glycosyltransferase involved in cell wall biosynthesis
MTTVAAVTGTRVQPVSWEALEVRLDSPLPAALSIGRGTALFVCGTCFDRDARIGTLRFVLDGQEQPVAAHSMPRLDYLRALHPRLDPYAKTASGSEPESADDPLRHSYRSGFWGIVRIAPAMRDGACVVALRGTMRDGRECTTELARLPIATPAQPPAAVAAIGGTGPLIAICMATYEPPLDLFRRQIESIRAQTHGNWICLISDDCSGPARLAAIQDVVGDDRRFVVSRSPRRQGFYLNFERSLAMVPPDAEFVALADQDDYWYPEKLATLLAQIGTAQLAYSDARIIGRDGAVISNTYWSLRTNNHSDLHSLLVANAVTGAASLLRREVLDYALPFPPAQFAHYHDHWIALVALVLGGIAFVDRPLYDYVQHGQAALGHAAANQTKTMRARLETLRRDPRERVRVNRTRYFVDIQRLMVFVSILQLRCDARMSDAHRRTLNEFLSVEESWPALARLARRAAVELSGRSGRPVTLGAEWALLQASLWRRMLGPTVRDRPRRYLRLDALPPPDLAPKPDRRMPDEPGPRLIAEKTAPLELAVSDDAPSRVNVLIPTIDLEHFFGGYIAKFNLAQRLAEHGARVRIVTVDAVGPLPRGWRSTIESYSGLTGLFESVEVAFGRESGGLEVSRHDRFIATTWWTAHLAQSAVTALGGQGFVYLIQEYEPFTFPMGSYAALAGESYRFPHFAVFSSELLRGYFRRHRIGVYAGGPEAGDAASASFENAITPITAPSAVDLASRSTRRLLFYARPEPHAARNMFDIGVLALQRALEAGSFRSGWELYGIGTVGAGRRVSLGGGTALQLLPRSAQGDYANVLRGHDVGLALMFTPHPSLVPIEMAAAGLLTVTNTFENKTRDAMSAISSNLIAAEPTIDGIAGALCGAGAGVEDFARRAHGSDVRWSRDWERSFDDELLGRVIVYFDARPVAVATGSTRLARQT